MQTYEVWLLDNVIEGANDARKCRSVNDWFVFSRRTIRFEKGKSYSQRVRSTAFCNIEKESTKPEYKCLKN